MKKKNRGQTYLGAIIKITTDFFTNNEPLYSTQAAFYFIISAVPLLMLLLAMIRYVFPINLNDMLQVMDANIPDPFAYYVKRVIREIYTQSSFTFISITAITTVWAGSKSTYALTLGLKNIYKTIPTTLSATKTIKYRLISLLDTLLLVFILMFTVISLVLDQVIEGIIIKVTPDKLIFILNFIRLSNISSMIVIAIAFMMIYKFFSRSSYALHKHLPGAIMASFAWVVFSSLYSLYFTIFPSFSITYGALAAIVFMMLWLKTCMMILLYGAQINMFLLESKKESEL